MTSLHLCIRNFFVQLHLVKVLHLGFLCAVALPLIVMVVKTRKAGPRKIQRVRGMLPSNFGSRPLMARSNDSPEIVQPAPPEIPGIVQPTPPDPAPYQGPHPDWSERETLASIAQAANARVPTQGNSCGVLLNKSLLATLQPNSGEDVSFDLDNSLATLLEQHKPAEKRKRDMHIEADQSSRFSQSSSKISEQDTARMESLATATSSPTSTDSHLSLKSKKFPAVVTTVNSDLGADDFSFDEFPEASVEALASPDEEHEIFGVLKCHAGDADEISFDECAEPSADALPSPGKERELFGVLPCHGCVCSAHPPCAEQTQQRTPQRSRGLHRGD